MLLLALCIPATLVFAQTDELPKLPDDSIYKKGNLPNGVAWYVVSNKTSVGRCDISLVQKIDPALSTDKALALARKRFSSVNLNGGGSVEHFLSRQGIRPGRNGYFNVRQGAICYDFKNCCTSRPVGSTDSLLLALARLVENSAPQPSSSQSLIICGDVDQSSIISKLSLLSLMTPAVPGEIPSFKYLWNPAKTYSISYYDGARVPQIRARWVEARIPDKYMPTILPAVSKKLSGEFGWMLKNRLSHAYRAAGLRVWVDYRYNNSEEGPDDETHNLTLSCFKSWRGQAKMILEDELDRLYAYGVSPEEYAYARDAFRQEWIDRSRELRVDNSQYVLKCKSAFLYGASLASESVKMERVYRPVPDSVQTRLFNEYMWKLLEQTSVRDSTLERSAHTMSRSQIEAALAHYIPFRTLKAPKAVSEPCTGGQMWTFSNGLNVIFKKVATGGQMHYSFASKGRRDAADEDFLRCLGAVDEENLDRYMASQGIKLDVVLGETDVRLQGYAPNENAERLFTLLAAIADQKENREAFASSNYKLLTLVSDMDEETLKKMLCRYSTTLGGGSSWKSGRKVVSEEPDSLRSPGGAVSVSKKMLLSKTTSNRVLARMAEFALKNSLAEAFAGCGVESFVRTYEAPFPSETFYLSLAVRRAPLANFMTGESYCKNEQGRILDVLNTLASAPLPDEKVNMYRKMTEDYYKSLISTPQHYVQVACERYLDNKDLFSKYSSVLKSVSAADLQKFFQALDSGSSSTKRAPLR